MSSVSTSTQKKNRGDFLVQTHNFEGPLDLLLHFIEKRKLHVSDVSLSQVVDDYMSFVVDLGQKESDPDELARFIVLISTLLLIKSKALLPKLQLTLEEESDIEHLERRLRAYEAVRGLMQGIEKRIKSPYLYTPRETQINIVRFSPGPDLNIQQIKDALFELREQVKSFVEPELPKARVKQLISLKEVITNLYKRIIASNQTSFHAFSKPEAHKKEERVVHFLALLELVKQGILIVTQTELFGDIVMEMGEVKTPQYGSEF